MHRIIIAFSLVLASPLLMASSCDRRQCPEDIACTEIFSMVTVQVSGPDGMPASLDEVYTIRTSTGEKIIPDQSIGGGVYVVLDDSYRQKLQQQKDEFRLVGMQNGQKVLEEPFVIEADCCHIRKVSGADTLQR